MSGNLKNSSTFSFSLEKIKEIVDTIAGVNGFTLRGSNLHKLVANEKLLSKFEDNRKLFEDVCVLLSDFVVDFSYNVYESQIFFRL